MANNTPGGAIRRCESTKPGGHQTTETFFFLPLQMGKFKTV